MKDQKKAPDLLSGETESKSGDEIEGQSARITRYSKAKRQADSHRQYIEEHLSEYQEREAAELVSVNHKLCSCGNYLLFRHYYTVGKVRLAKAHFCKKHLVCPLCAIRRGARSVRVYLERFIYLRTVYKGLTASLVTITVKNGPDLMERLGHLQNGIKKANQRIRNFKRGRGKTSVFRLFLGYVGSYEIKRGKRSKLWHPHCHMIVLHDQAIDPQELSREWLQITGDSFIVDVSPIQNPDDPAADFCEVFKYAVKFTSMETADLIHAYFKLSGKNLVFSGGLLRGLKVPEDLTDDLIEDLPYIELMYRYTEAGYSLTEVKKVDV